MNVFIGNKRLLGLLLVLVSCLLIVGCSENDKTKTVEAKKPTQSVAKDEAVIQAFIEKHFNGPDKKYRELWNAAMEIQTAEMNEEDYNAWMNGPEYTALTDYMSDTYALYFTENTYDAFSKTEAFAYSFSDQAYKITPSAIEIKQNEIEKTLYNFTFHVIYENETGEKETFEYEGKAIVPIEGKIGKIQFNDQEGLLQKIVE